MAQRIEIYRGSDSKTKGQGVKHFQKKRKGSVSQVQGQPSREMPQVNAVQPQQKKKQGQKGKGKSQKEDADQLNAIAVEEIILCEIAKSSRMRWPNCVPRENRSPDFPAHTG